MEIIKKYKVLLVVALLALGGVSFLYRLYHHDVKALGGFVASYERFDKATSDFSTSILASNPENASALDRLNKIYSQIIGSLQDPRPNSNRLALAKEAIALNNDLFGYLNKTDDVENKARDALVELNTKSSVRISSLIKNDGELMSKELEIADYSKKELDTLSTYKKAIRDKGDITNQSLQKIVDDKGGLGEFIEFVNQKDNQAKIQSEGGDSDALSKELNDLHNNRTSAYARFQKLAEMKSLGR